MSTNKLLGLTIGYLYAFIAYLILVPWDWIWWFLAGFFLTDAIQKPRFEVARSIINGILSLVKKYVL